MGQGGLVFEEHHDGGEGENVGTGIKDPLKDLVYRVHPLPEAMVDHVFDFGSLAPDVEALFIRAKLAQLLSPYTPEALWDVKEALEATEGVGEAAVKIQGHRIIGYIKPDQNDEQKLMEVLDGWGERQAPLSKKPGSSVSDEWKFKDLGWVKPEDDKLDTTLGMKGKGKLPPHLYPSVIISLRDFQPQNCMEVSERQFEKYNLMEHFDTLKDINASERSNLDEEKLEKELNVASGAERKRLLQLGFVGKAVDLTKREATVPADGRLSTFGVFVEVFRDLICNAQEFIRERSGGERSSASMRDVVRCIKVYRWFLKHFAETSKRGKKGGKFTMQDQLALKEKTRTFIYEAVVLSLAYCYQARLPREDRKLLRISLATKMKGEWWDSAPWLKMEPSKFVKIVEKTQIHFVEQMNLGDGIALNEALCENLFMLLVSVLNQIPIFVVGKPGSSKSLAMRLLQDNLKGEASANGFLKALPAVTVFSYQCSPLSTSVGIEQAVAQARRYRQSSTNTITVVLLDEVGLAEQSPHLPLKVLHKVLDEAMENETLVGISNWTLDPAKMNRAVHLYRPAPTEKDLAKTAEGMVGSGQANLKGYLQSLAKAYNAVYEKQQKEGAEQSQKQSADGSLVRIDFWGLREFYATVKFISSHLQSKDVGEREIDPKMLLQGVLRNYGGYPLKIDQIVGTFFDQIGLQAPETELFGIMDLIRQNVYDQDARHLMLLTKNNAALPILFDQNILSHEKTDIIIGSDFPHDQSDLQICHDIQRVKQNMASGTTVVLLHCEALYESLYDLLNQHYTTHGGNRFVRLALGTHNVLCPVHEKFRVIVITEKADAYTVLAPPLLNRFEKQVLERANILKPKHIQMVARLQEFCLSFAAQLGGQEEPEEEEDADEEKADDMDVDKAESQVKQDDIKIMNAMRAAFCGYHSDFLSSLALLVCGSEDSEANVSEAEIEDAITRLLWCATPEAVCRLSVDHLQQLNSQYDLDVEDCYFREQKHSTLAGFVEAKLPEWRDDMGSQVMVMTYAPLDRVDPIVESLSTHGYTVKPTVLHELTSERDLTTQVTSFFEEATDGSLLLIQCDPLAASLRRVEHAKFICENERARTFSQKFGGSEGSARAPKGIHVVLLLHLPRAGDKKFCVDFSPHWRCAFVDSMSTSNRIRGLPSVESIIADKKKMSEVISAMHDSGELKVLLEQEFRRALSQLVYPHKRSYQSVCDHITTVVKFLGEDKDFLESVCLEILGLVKQHFDQTDMVLAARQGNQLTISGTFQAAIHAQIINTVSRLFAFVLEHMDRDYGLALFANPKLKKLWLFLFHKSFHITKQTFVAAKAKNQRNVSCDVAGKPVNGVMEKFTVKFPFSFYIRSQIDSMKALAEGANTELYLTKQLSRFIKLQNVNTPHLSEDIPAIQELLSDADIEQPMVEDYVYDFTCMNMEKVKGLDREKHARAIWQILVKGSHTPSDQKLTKLTTVHARYWEFERPLKLYFKIIDTVPECADEAADYMASIDKYLDSAIHVGVLSLAFKKLEPSAQAWDDVNQYFKWLLKVEQVQAAVESLLDVCHSSHATDSELPSHVAGCQEDWDRMLVFYSFIRDVAWPLALSPVFTLRVLAEIRSFKVRSRDTFRGLLRILSEDELKASSQVFTEVGKGKKTPKEQADQQQQAVFTFERAAYRFMQYFIFDVCFSSAGIGTLQIPLLTDLIAVLAGNPPDGQILSFEVLPSEASKIALLRDLLRLPSGEVQQSVIVKLQEQMQLAVRQAQHSDTGLSVSFCNLKEEERMESPPNLEDYGVSKSRFSELKLDDIKSFIADDTPEGKAKLPQMLTTAAHVRFLVVEYSHMICQAVDPAEDADAEKVTEVTKQLAVLQPAIDSVLDDSATSERIVRSMRMFLLKSLERERGISFVRSALQQEPLSKSPWVQGWKDNTEDVAFQLFVGHDKIPPGNPFKPLKHFKEVDEAIGRAMATSDTEELDELVKKHQSDRFLKGALLGALFKNVYVLAVLEGGLTGKQGQNRKRLCKWVATTEALSFVSDSERQVLHFFAGKGAGFDDEVDSSNPLFLDETSTPEKIQQVRVLAHLAAVSLCAEKGSSLEIFHTLLFAPGQLQKKFFPTMPQDEFFMITKALKERQNVRWKVCANCKYRFFISECGGAMQKRACPQCGHEIGGEHHKATTNTVELPGQKLGENQIFVQSAVEDNSQPGYCLRQATEEQDKYAVVRELEPKSFRTFRMMLHAALMMSCLIGGETHRTQISSLLNENFNAHPPKGEALIPFFYTHMRSDWGLIRALFEISPDDIATMMHKCLGTLYVAPPSAACFDTSAQRDQWELDTDKCGIKALLCAPDITEQLQHVMKEEFGGGKEDESDDTGEFIEELMETFDITKISAKDRRLQTHALWTYRPKFTISKFEAKLLSPDVKAKYNLLAEFMEKEVRLRGLKHLPAVLEWMNLITMHYGRRLTKKRSEELTVGEVILEQPVEARSMWEDAFAGFAAGWNSTWEQVKRHGCLRIEHLPEDVRSLVMDRDKPICYSCVHDEEGQGILVAALINFMCTQHNDFVRLIDETMLKNNRHEHRDAVSQSVVPLAEVLPAHMLVYDFQGSFMPLIEKQCVSFTPQGAVEYDFETAQQYLLNKWLCKPEIEAVIGNFLFLEEQEAKNALKQLGKIVKQKPLPKQVEKGIRQEITNPIQAQACLDALSTCVSFLKGAVLESGDAMVEDDDLAKMGIGKYAADTLKMEGSAFGSKTVSGQVELCHLSNLWELLLEIVDPDPTAEVHEVYKAPLTAEQEKQISAAAATFDDGFAETMSEFMQQYLKEHNMKKDDPLKSTLGYCEMGDEYLFQLQWFSNTFDDSFKLEQIVAIFKLITSS
jgi:hypothetical protein